MTSTGTALRRFEVFVDRLASAVSRSWQNAHCVFILSTGRTGTVTLIHFLDSFSDAMALHEPEPNCLNIFKESFKTFGSNKHSSEFTRLFSRCRKHLLHRAARDDKMYIEATLFKYIAPALSRMLPNARFVHLHRHPAEVVRSGMRRGWYDRHAWDWLKPEPCDNDNWATEWPHFTAFQKNCWLWNAENSLFLNFAQSLPPHRTITIPSAAIFRQELVVVRKLVDFCGLNPMFVDDDRLQILSKRNNAQSHGSFPHWADWQATQVEELTSICGATAAQLGYEDFCCHTASEDTET